MEIGTRQAAVPLFESGDAPRILVTGVDRLELVDEGIYCFVCTCKSSVGGTEERKVVLYLDATPSAIATGITMALMKVKELAGGFRLPSFLTRH